MKDRGVLISLISSVSFAIFSFIASFTAPLSGMQVWGWRIVVTVPGVWILLLIAGRFYWITDELRAVMHEPRKLLCYLFCVPMLTVQMALFGWAPQSGHTLDMTIGYFLMPIVMVVVGCALFHEKLSMLSLLATTLACVAVGYEIYRTFSLSWVTLVVSLGYPAYFVIRKKFGCDGVGTLTWEMTCALPLALYYAFGHSAAHLVFQSLRLSLAVLGLGGISVIGLITYVLAAKKLPYSIFGLLSYVEPILITGVALLIGERIAPDQWPTYIGIWSAVCILGLDGLLRIMRHKKIPFTAVRPWRRRTRIR